MSILCVVAVRRIFLATASHYICSRDKQQNLIYTDASKKTKNRHALAETSDVDGGKMFLEYIVLDGFDYRARLMTKHAKS
jgi:hypothetical protein